MAVTPNVSKWGARYICSIQRPVAAVPKPHSRIAIADRDAGHATVVSACIKWLALASASDVARVGAATPPSKSPLKNANDPGGGRIGFLFADLCEHATLVFLYEDTPSILQKAFG